MLESFKNLAYASEVEFLTAAPDELQGLATATTEHARIFMPMSDLVDTKKEIERLERELSKAEKDLEIVTKKLSNPGFLNKAPAAIVEAEREKEKSIRSVIDNIKENLSGLI